MQCKSAEAFQVEPRVVMAVAEAVLGEADMLAVVVACEAQPQYSNAPHDSPRRLPEDCEVRMSIFYSTSVSLSPQSSSAA